MFVGEKKPPGHPGGFLFGAAHIARAGRAAHCIPGIE